MKNESVKLSVGDTVKIWFEDKNISGPHKCINNIQFCAKGLNIS